MIFPWGIEGSVYRMQPDKGRETENETSKIKGFCKLARRFKAKGRKPNGTQTKVGYIC